MNNQNTAYVNSELALHIAYAISDFDPSDEIWYQQTLFSTAEAVSLANLKPVFMDV